LRQPIHEGQIEQIEPAMVEVLRRKTAAERIEMISAANRTARLLTAAGIRFQNPGWTEEQIKAEVIKRVSGGTGRSTHICR
jgi:hypothetical protein